MLERLITPQITTGIMEPFFRFMGRRDRSGQADPHNVKKMLVVKLDGIGDMILASPLLRELRASLPEAHITLVVSPHLVNLVELCPYVDEILTFPWGLTGRWGNLRRYGRVLRLSLQQLWRQCFELALVPHWDTDWYEASSLCYFSGATRRVGYSEQVNAGKKIINRGFDHYYTDTINDPSLKHEVERNLQLLQYLGFQVGDSHLECWTSPHDDLVAKNVLLNFSAHKGQPLIVFATGANCQRRIWPLNNFIEIGSWLINNYQARIVLVGGPQDFDAAQKIQTRLGPAVINVAGLLTLRQTASLMRYSLLYCGNDTGPMHLAAANKLPVVEISCHPLNGSPSHVHSPHRFGPWGVSHIVLQPRKPLGTCSQECLSDQAHCILNVALDDVKAACREMLANKTQPS
jgi:ADP-heptose:LPS heptosyltransferase